MKNLVFFVMSNDKNHQSIRISGSFLNNNQFGQSARDQSQIQNNIQEKTTFNSDLEDIISLFKQLENLLHSSDISPNQASKALRYLEIAKEEVKDEEGNREFAAENLKRLVSTLESTDKAMGFGQSILDKAKPLLNPILKYLGLTISSLL